MADTLNPTIGLRYTNPGDRSAVFIHLPRVAALNIMRECRHLYMVVRSCAKSQCKSLSRATGNQVFIEDNHKYYCVGSQTGRAERGVPSGTYRLKNGFASKDWDAIHKVLKKAEHAFDRYLDTKVTRHVNAAKGRINFRTMEPAPLSQMKSQPESIVAWVLALVFTSGVLLTKTSLCQLSKPTSINMISLSLTKLYATLLFQE